MDNEASIAAREGDLPKLKQRLDRVIDINARDASGLTLLHHAAGNGRVEVVECLLQNGADVLATTTDKSNSALHIAVTRGDDALVNVILKSVARSKLKELLDAKTRASGTAALHVAAKRNSRANVTSLLQYGADFEIANVAGERPIDLATRGEEPRRLLQLIGACFAKARRGEMLHDVLVALCDDSIIAVMNCRDNEGRTLLQVLVLHCKIVDALLNMPSFLLLRERVFRLRDCDLRALREWSTSRQDFDELVERSRDCRRLWLALVDDIPANQRLAFERKACTLSRFTSRVGEATMRKVHELLLAYRRMEAEDKSLRANAGIESLGEMFELIGYEKQQLHVAVGQSNLFANFPINSDRKKDIDSLLGRFFFGCNIPFVISESEYFKDFVKALNPSYDVPCRKTVSGPILENCFNDYKKQVKNDTLLEGVLLIDGWKNKVANTKNVVAMVRLDNGRFLFLESWNFSVKSETGINLNDVVQEAIAIARDTFNVHIYAVISDNASNMMLMGKLSNLWHLTCNSHSGNLLGEKLSTMDEDFGKKVGKVLTEFKNTVLENLVVAAGGRKMILPGETRWCSRRDAYRRCLRNVPKMRKVVNDGAIIKNEVRLILFDNNFEAELIDHIMILDPVCRLIRQCEKVTVNIADATELWLQFEIPAINDEFDRVVQDRVDKVINCYGLAANFLHPVYKGIRFSDNNTYIEKMDSFFEKELTHNGLQELDEYKLGLGFFETLFNKNYTSWEVFWKAAEYFYPELSKLALKLFNICAATSELERLFSQWSYVKETDC